MPPKKKLTKEEIIDCAFGLLREGGMAALNARALADRLGCSTMPLFREFSNMEELRQATVGRALERYHEYVRKGMEAPLPFKGLGMAYIRFAREEPKLFQLFYMTPAGTYAEVPSVDPNQVSIDLVASSVMGGSVEEGQRVLREMWIFVHGIATMIVLGTMDFNEEEISEMLTDVFSGLRENRKEKKNG